MSWAEEVFKDQAQCSLTTRSEFWAWAVNLVSATILLVVLGAGLIPSHFSKHSWATDSGKDLRSVHRKGGNQTIRGAARMPGEDLRPVSRTIPLCAGEGDQDLVRSADPPDFLPAENPSAEADPSEHQGANMGGGQGSQQQTSTQPYYGSVYGGAAMGPSPQFSFTPPDNSQVQPADPFNDSFKLLMDDLYQRMKARAANDSDNPFFAQDVGWADDSSQIGF